MVIPRFILNIFFKKFKIKLSFYLFIYIEYLEICTERYMRVFTAVVRSSMENKLYLLGGRYCLKNYNLINSSHEAYK